MNRPRQCFHLLWRLAAVCVALWSPAAQARSPVWFGDVREPVELTPAQAQTMFRWVAGDGSSDLSEFHADRAPRIVFLSVGDGKSAARVSIGAGRGWAEALLLARGGIARRDNDRFHKLDWVNHVTRLDPDAPIELETGVEGLALADAALPPEVLAVSGAIDAKQSLDRQRYAAAYEKYLGHPLAALPREREDYHRFDAVSYFFDGQSVTRLYRGHRTFDDELTDAQLLETAKAAGAYLARNVDDSGRFVYEYQPILSRSRDDRYNMLRHAGTIYAMMELYESAPNETLLASARRAIEYLISHAVKPWTVAGQDVRVVVDDQNEIKLGGNALSMIALIQYTNATGDRQYLELLDKLAQWIVLTQQSSGRFGVQKQMYPTGEITDMESDYYPGQAIMALCRLHALNPDGAYLDAADKAAKYLITIHYGSFTDAELFHDHWLMYGLSELARHRSDPLYLAHAKRLARVIMATQIRTPLWPDWRGGYYRPPRGNPTATRSEGLGAVHSMAVADADVALASQIRDAVMLAVRFQLQLQFDDASAMYFDDPQFVIGAFRNTLSDPDVRIDTVQHNVSAILGLLRIRAARDAAPAPVP